MKNAIYKGLLVLLKGTIQKETLCLAVFRFVICRVITLPERQVEILADAFSSFV